MGRFGFLGSLSVSLLALVLPGCGKEPPADERQTLPRDEAPPVVALSDPPSSVPSPAPTMVSPVYAADAANDGYPDLTPLPLTPTAERTEKGARNVLLAWARAIELREFDQAWALMSPADHRKWSREDWADMFADLAEITVSVPDGTIEGAAGSSYYTGVATITARDAAGRPIRYQGPVVLRRVNDVAGASLEQLHWHIESVALDSTH